jgi:ABC-2 type transport system permease protein
MNAMWRLTQRELRRFIRRPSQVGATLATPAVIWVFLAAGLGKAAEGYAGALAPGMAILVVLFATVFAGMSLIEDRHAGLLRGVLVSPVPRRAVAGGKLLPAALIAVAQALPVLLAALLLDDPPPLLGVALGLGVLALVALGVGGLGLALAWWIDSPRGFHGLVTAAIMPLWLLSGPVFPEGAAAGWIRTLEIINPVAWCARTLDAALTLSPGDAPLATLGTLAFAGAGLAAATLSVGRSAR